MSALCHYQHVAVAIGNTLMKDFVPLPVALLPSPGSVWNGSCSHDIHTIRRAKKQNTYYIQSTIHYPFSIGLLLMLL